MFPRLSNTTTGWLGLALLAVCIAVVTVRAQDAGAALAYAPNMVESAGRVAGALFAIAVFLERALAVLNNLWSGEALREREAATRAESYSPESLRAVAEVEGWRERVRLGFGFVFALLISAAGARTLEGLMIIGSDDDRLALFRGLDMVLTAGLLAGGSNALGRLAEVFRRRTDDVLAGLRVNAARRGPAARGPTAG